MDKSLQEPFLDPPQLNSNVHPKLEISKNVEQTGSRHLTPVAGRPHRPGFYRSKSTPAKTFEKSLSTESGFASMPETPNVLCNNWNPVSDVESPLTYTVQGSALTTQLLSQKRKSKSVSEASLVENGDEIANRHIIKPKKCKEDSTASTVGNSLQSLSPSFLHNTQEDDEQHSQTPVSQATGESSHTTKDTVKGQGTDSTPKVEEDSTLKPTILSPIPKYEEFGWDFTGRDITDRDITGRDITGRDITDRDITGRDITDRDITGRDITGRDMSGAEGGTQSDQNHVIEEPDEAPCTSLNTDPTSPILPPCLQATRANLQLYIPGQQGNTEAAARPHHGGARPKTRTRTDHTTGQNTGNVQYITRSPVNTGFDQSSTTHPTPLSYITARSDSLPNTEFEAECSDTPPQDRRIVEQEVLCEEMYGQRGNQISEPQTQSVSVRYGSEAELCSFVRCGDCRRLIKGMEGIILHHMRRRLNVTNGEYREGIEWQMVGTPLGEGSQSTVYMGIDTKDKFKFAVKKKKVPTATLR